MTVAQTDAADLRHPVNDGAALKDRIGGLNEDCIRAEPLHILRHIEQERTLRQHAQKAAVAVPMPPRHVHQLIRPRMSLVLRGVDYKIRADQGLFAVHGRYELNIRVQLLRQLSSHSDNKVQPLLIDVHKRKPAAVQPRRHADIPDDAAGKL